MLICNPNNAFGGLLAAQVQFGGKGVHGVLCGYQIQGHVPAQKVLRLQAPQHGVRICDSGARAALSVTRRSRISTGRLRSYLQHAPGIGISERAAASTDGVHINLSNRHRPRPDMALIGQLYAAVNQGNVGRGATHIKGKQFCESGLFAQELGGRQAASRPGQQHIHRHVASVLGVHHPAGGLHYR